MKVRPKLLRKLKLLMILCFIGAIVMTLGTVMEVLEINELKEKGITVQGVYHSDQSLSTGKGRTAYRIVVDYTPVGLIEHRKLFVVSEKTYQKIKNEGTTEVVYLQRSAGVSEVQGNLKHNYEKGAIAVGLLIVGLGIAFYFRNLGRKIDKEIGYTP